jgi:hypothetical protein
MDMAGSKEELLETFNAPDAETKFGSGDIAVAELGSLRDLYGRIYRETANLVGGSEETNLLFTPYEQLTPEQIEQRKVLRDVVIAFAREETISEIIERGWPQPEHVSDGDVGETGLNHGCVVTKYLWETRGVAANPNTFFSYTSKDQFDRFGAMGLNKMGRLKAGGDLYAEWHGLQDREPGYSNPTVEYPVGVDNTKIYGLAKPHRYWPSQLLRNMEDLRLGRMSQEAMDKLYVGDTSVDEYSIPWVNFMDVYQHADSVDSIAVGVAVRTMEILSQRGLSNDQITELVVGGYSPSGPISEHGKIPEVGIIWTKLLDEVADSSSIGYLLNDLHTKVQAKFDNADYSFNYSRE